MVFTPEAEGRLDELYIYIAEAATPEIAAGYVDAIIGILHGGRDYESNLADDAETD